MRRMGIAAGAVGVTAVAVVLVVMACWAGASRLRAGETAGRPKILGIAGVEITSSNVEAAKLFYGRLVEMDGPCNWCENNPYSGVEIASGLVVGVSRSGRKPPMSMLVSVSFVVDNEKAMKRWLAANNIRFKETLGPYRDRDTYLLVLDPEGHELYFRNAAHWDKTDYGHLPVIHAGFVVKDRAAMDRLYKDVLGFHVYWHGGMRY